MYGHASMLSLCVHRLDRVTIRDQDEVEKQTVELEKDKQYAAELRKKESHRVSGT